MLLAYSTYTYSGEMACVLTYQTLKSETAFNSHKNQPVFSINRENDIQILQMIYNDWIWSFDCIKKSLDKAC